MRWEVSRIGNSRLIWAERACRFGMQRSKWEGMFREDKVADGYVCQMLAKARGCLFGCWTNRASGLNLNIGDSSLMDKLRFES